MLTLDELRTVWEKLETVKGVSNSLKGVLRLIVLTAQRPGECVAVERTEVDGDWWTIPGPKAKNGLPHRVPLTSLAKGIVDSQPENGRYVFRGRGDRAMQVNALARAVRRVEWSIAPWTPHDLRRSVASHMTGAGGSRLVVGRLLNHAERSVTAVYDRHSYDNEKQSALETWERLFRSALTGKKSDVVEFSR